MPRTKIAGVIRVYAVSHRDKSLLFRQFIKHIKKFILAVVAAVTGIRPVRGIFHLTRFDKFVPHSSVCNKFVQLRSIVCGIAWRNCGHRKRACTKRLIRRPRQVRGIRSPGNCDQQGRQRRQPRQQLGFFARRVRFSRFLLTNLYQRTHRRKYIVRNGLLAYSIRPIQPYLKSSSTSTIPFTASARNQCPTLS